MDAFRPHKEIGPKAIAAATSACRSKLETAIFALELVNDTIYRCREAKTTLTYDKMLDLQKEVDAALQLCKREEVK